ncbi:MAG: hypothetical protein AAGF23_14285, partial [Acidobacteriota bacterium]
MRPLFAALLVAALAPWAAAPGAAEDAAPVDKPWRGAAPFSLDAGELYAASQRAVDDPFTADAGVVV